MVLNLEQLPKAIAEDIEVQSLALLRDIKEHLVVIGGWGARAWTQDVASRSTIDVDGVAEEEELLLITTALTDLGLSGDQEDWGTRFHKRYVPSTSEAIREATEAGDLSNEIQIRIEISKTRIP